MGKVNVCLKRIYIIVISLIGILSALLLAVTLFAHGFITKEEQVETMIPSISLMYIISIITLILAIVGMYGACKEKKWALIMFAVGMILGSLFWIITDIHGLVQRQQFDEHLKRNILQMLPLNNASEITTDHLKIAQIEMQCCGLDQGYPDWGYDIPVSCLCTKETTNPCVEAPRNSSLFEDAVHDQPIMIYKESCLPYLIAQVKIVTDATLGIVLGVMLLWLLSVVLCIFILCRLNKKEDTPTVVYSSQAKAGDYMILTDAAEHT